MVTLANFDGRSLALDLDAAFSPALKQKYVERKANEREQQDIDLLRTAQGLAPETVSAPDKKSQGFLRRLAPALADQLDKMNQDRNPDAVDELRKEAAMNVETAARIRKATSPAEKQRIILERASEFQKQGRDNRQLLKMSGMTPAEIDLQAQKAEMMGNATLKSLPPPTEGERMAARAQLAVRNPQAYAALMRDEAVKRQEEAQRAAQARAGAAQAQKEREAAQQAQIMAQMRAGAGAPPAATPTQAQGATPQQQFDAVGGAGLSFGEAMDNGQTDPVAQGDPGLSFGELAQPEVATPPPEQVDLIAQADATYRQAQAATARAIAQRDSITDPKMRAMADTVVKEFEESEKAALENRNAEIDFAKDTAPQDVKTIEAADGFLYYLNGPQKGERVFPDVDLKDGSTETIYDRDGNPIVVRGSGAAPLRESESKDNVFKVRAEGALDLLDEIGADVLTSRGDVLLDQVPLGLGREFQDEDFQVAQQAGNEFLQAILRKDTGAAITEGEQVLYGQTYIPQPGDGPRVVAAKKASRVRAIEAIGAGMSPIQIVMTERALVNAAKRMEEGDEFTPLPSVPEEFSERPKGKILTFNPETGKLE